MSVFPRQVWSLMLVFLLLACSARSGPVQAPPGSDAPAASPPAVDSSTPVQANQSEPGGEASPGVDLTLLASSQQPAAGETVVLSITLAPQEDMPAAQIILDLPPEASAIDGPFHWQGDLSRGKPQALQVKLEIKQWPLSTPVKVTLTDNISTYWAYWPAPAQAAPSAGLRDVPRGAPDGSHLQGVEPSPSVAVTLQAGPANPAPGQATRFSVTLVAMNDFSGVHGRFELPPQFQLDPGSRLDWQGDLARGAPLELSIWATPVEPPAGAARFVLDLGQGEVIHSDLAFGQAAPSAPRRLPQGQFREDLPAPPADLRDAIPPPPGAVLAPQSSRPLVDFTVLETALEGDQAALTVFMLANTALTNGQLVMVLPPGLTLLDGALEWQGDLQVDDVISLELRLARPLSGPPGTLDLRFSADQGSAAPYFYPLNLPDAGAEAPAVSEVSAPSGTISLSGRFVYTDDSAATQGIYYAAVEVYDEDGATDEFVCGATTDADGYWSCSGPASDGTSDTTVEIYAKVRAYHSEIGLVRESSGTEYAFVTSTHNMSSATGTSYNFGTWWPGTQGGNSQNGAFHIQRINAYGWTITYYVGGETPPSHDEEHFVNFVWPDTDSDSTSEYGGWIVYIEGPGATDEDQWDESPILHEYGHYLMDHFAVLSSPDYCHDAGEVAPNCGHSMNSHEDPTTAYLEGWANYFQSAARSYSGMADPHIYYETSWSFNIENSWHDTATTWDDAESTPTAIMWDLNDSANDDQNSDGIGDATSQGHEEIHDVFSNNPTGYGTPVDIHDFYDSFLGRYSVDSYLMRIYFEHGINKDTTDPTGSVSINSGATYVQSTGVTLNVSASDPAPGVGAIEMRFQNSGGSWSTWEDYAASKSWTLTSSNGTKTVYAQFRDGAGNTSTSYNDTIILDNVAPSNPTSFSSSSHSLSDWSNDNTIAASWSGASDATSGVDGYSISWTTSATTVPDTVMDSSSASATSAALADGNAWYLHVRTVDNAGNWNSGAAHYGPFFIDTHAPSSSVGALPAAVCAPFRVSWSGSDPAPASGVSRYTVQYKAGSGAWTTWLTSTSLTSSSFGPTSPVTTVAGQTYAFRVIALDVAGNWEAYPASADATTMVNNCIYLPLTLK